MSYHQYHAGSWPPKRTIYSEAMAQTFPQNRSHHGITNTAQLMYNHLSKDREPYYNPVNYRMHDYSDRGWSGKDDRIADIDQRLDNIDQWIDRGWSGKDARIEKINERINDLSVWIDRGWIGKDERIEKINDRINMINDRLLSMNYEWKGKDERMDKIDERLGKLEQRIDKVNQRITSITGGVAV